MKKIEKLRVKKAKFKSKMGQYSVEGIVTYIDPENNKVISSGGTRMYCWTNSQTEAEAYDHLLKIWSNPRKYQITHSVINDRPGFKETAYQPNREVVA